MGESVDSIKYFISDTWQGQFVNKVPTLVLETVQA